MDGEKGDEDSGSCALDAHSVSRHPRLSTSAQNGEEHEIIPTGRTSALFGGTNTHEYGRHSADQPRREVFSRVAMTIADGPGRGPPTLRVSRPTEALTRPLSTIGSPHTASASLGSISSEDTGDLAGWLLPYPFRDSPALPVGDRTRFEGARFRIPSLSSASPLNERGRTSGASTPSSLGKTFNDSAVRSPYFHRSTTVAEPSDALTDSTFETVMGNRPDMARGHHSTRYGHQQFEGHPTERARHAATGHLGSHPVASGDSDAGSLTDSLTPSRHTQPAFPRLQQSAAPESEYGDGPSVTSRAVTQTLTPNTSPFQRGPARTGPPERSVRGEVSMGRQSHHRFPLQLREQDSSILSPLGRPLSQQAIRPAPCRIGRSPAQLSNPTEGSTVFDFDLSSDSGSEGGGSNQHMARTAQTPRPRNREPTLENVSDPSEEHDRVVCAISESRSSDMVGVAVVNITIGHVELIRVVNDDKYRRLTETLLRMPIQPRTFLVLKKVIDQRNRSSLVLCLEDSFPGARIVPLDREHWNESQGLKMVDRFAWRRDVKALRRNLEHNFYVSCAFSALMAFIEEQTDVVFREHSLRIKYKQPADTMGLDRCSITSLELFQNVRNSKNASHTLFGLLNSTLTPQGRRMLRSAILQPSTNRDEITARHEAVEELSSNEDLFTELRAGLKKLLHIDVERSIPWLSLKDQSRLPLQDGVSLIEGRYQIVASTHEELKGAETDLNQILMLKAYLGGVQAVRETLEAADCTSQILTWALETCNQEIISPIVSLIDDSIESGAIYSKAPVDVRNNRLWAFKAEPNSVLEGARELYRERTDEMHQYVEGLSKTFQEHLGAVPELRLANDNHYYMRFQWLDVERALSRQETPAESGPRLGRRHWRPRLLGGVETVNGVRRKQHYDCQTLELIQRSSQIQRHADIVTSQSDVYVVDLKTALLEHAETLLAVNETMALLDMLCSFAQVATTQNYVRPMLADTLVLKAARHPVMEAKRPSFVANDVYSGDSSARFQVVTGGNMSGKSTFIKTVALIQIMMQIGSFVPATSAAIPICDRLFTRLSTEDKPESNMGTFAVEMTEMNMILRQATQNSLVIIDELGRGTSTNEGLAIALSIAEELIKRKCRVFFATHFTELARVLNSTQQNSVLNVHVTGESTKSGDTVEISLPHTIRPGPVKNEDYGLELARRFLPELVVSNAEKVAKFLRDLHARNPTGPATRAAKQNKLILALPDLLKQAHDSTMDDAALASYIRKLQTEFTVRMNTAADDEGQDAEPTKSAERTVSLPILAKPSPEELETWQRKCDAAEKRVMHANTAGAGSQDRKRPAAFDGISEYPHKRGNAADDSQSTPPSSHHPTPVNRRLLIDELRRSTCTPTSRAVTPSSLQTDLPMHDDESESAAPTSPTRMRREQEDTPMEDAGPTRGLARAASISSGEGSSSHDAEMVDIGEAEAAGDNNNNLPGLPAQHRDDWSSEAAQPLESFQPLREWYARQEQAGGNVREASEMASTPESLLRSHGYHRGQGDAGGRDEDDMEV